MGAEALARVGVVGKALGLKGEVHVHPDPDLDDGFPPGRTYRVVEGPAGAPDTLVISASRLHGGRRVVRFEGVDDREAVRALHGVVLGVPRADADVGEGAFWASDLVGREVVSDDGAVVGVVQGLRDGYAHDYLVLARPDGGEVLVPAVDQLLEIDDERIVVHAIPGLLEDTP